MISQRKNYIFSALLTLTTALSLQAIELNHKDPFNIYKFLGVETPKDPFNVVTLPVKDGEYVTTVAFSSFLGYIMGELVGEISGDLLNLHGHSRTFGLCKLLGISYQYFSSSKLLNHRNELARLCGNETFLNMIETDNAFLINAWLKFYTDYALLKNNEGQTALMLAAQHGSINVAKELIAAGADLNARDNKGNTALDYALQSGNFEMIELLAPPVA